MFIFNFYRYDLSEEQSNFVRGGRVKKVLKNIIQRI